MKIELLNSVQFKGYNSDGTLRYADSFCMCLLKARNGKKKDKNKYKFLNNLILFYKVFNKRQSKFITE